MATTRPLVDSAVYAAQNTTLTTASQNVAELETEVDTLQQTVGTTSQTLDISNLNIAFGRTIS